MKKLLSLIVFVLISTMFLSTNTYAQNNQELARKMIQHLHRYIHLNGDAQSSNLDAIRIRTRAQSRLRLQDGSCGCSEFVDADGDGKCDNCDENAVQTRTRTKSGKKSRNKGGK